MQVASLAPAADVATAPHKSVAAPVISNNNAKKMTKKKKEKKTKKEKKPKKEKQQQEASLSEPEDVEKAAAAASKRSKTASSKHKRRKSVPVSTSFGEHGGLTKVRRPNRDKLDGLANNHKKRSNQTKQHEEETEEDPPPPHPSSSAAPPSPPHEATTATKQRYRMLLVGRANELLAFSEPNHHKTSTEAVSSLDSSSRISPPTTPPHNASTSGNGGGESSNNSSPSSSPRIMARRRWIDDANEKNDDNKKGDDDEQHHNDDEEEEASIGISLGDEEPTLIEHLEAERKRKQKEEAKKTKKTKKKRRQSMDTTEGGATFSSKKSSSSKTTKRKTKKSKPEMDDGVAVAATATTTSTTPKVEPLQTETGNTAIQRRLEETSEISSSASAFTDLPKARPESLSNHHKKTKRSKSGSKKSVGSKKSSKKKEKKHSVSEKESSSSSKKDIHVANNSLGKHLEAGQNAVDSKHHDSWNDSTTWNGSTVAPSSLLQQSTADESANSSKKSTSSKKSSKKKKKKSSSEKESSSKKGKLMAKSLEKHLEGDQEAMNISNHDSWHDSNTWTGHTVTPSLSPSTLQQQQSTADGDEPFPFHVVRKSHAVVGNKKLNEKDQDVEDITERTEDETSIGSLDFYSNSSSSLRVIKLGESTGGNNKSGAFQGSLTSLVEDDADEEEADEEDNEEEDEQLSESVVLIDTTESENIDGEFETQNVSGDETGVSVPPPSPGGSAGSIPGLEPWHSGSGELLESTDEEGDSPPRKARKEQKSASYSSIVSSEPFFSDNESNSSNPEMVQPWLPGDDHQQRQTVTTTEELSVRPPAGTQSVSSKDDSSSRFYDADSTESDVAPWLRGENYEQTRKDSFRRSGRSKSEEHWLKYTRLDDDNNSGNEASLDHEQHDSEETGHGKRAKPRWFSLNRQPSQPEEVPATSAPAATENATVEPTADAAGVDAIRSTKEQAEGDAELANAAKEQFKRRLSLLDNTGIPDKAPCSPQRDTNAEIAEDARERFARRLSLLDNSELSRRKKFQLSMRSPSYPNNKPQKHHHAKKSKKKKKSKSKNRSAVPKDISIS